MGLFSLTDGPQWSNSFDGSVVFFGCGSSMPRFCNPLAGSVFSGVVVAKPQRRLAELLGCRGLFCVSPGWGIGGAQGVALLLRAQQRTRRDRYPPTAFGEHRSGH